MVTMEARDNQDTMARSIAATALTSEQMLRWQAQTFVANHDAIIVSDLNGRILDWNPAAERIYGYSRDEMLGKTTAVLHRTEDAATLPSAMLDAMAGHGAWTGEMTFVRKDGTTGVTETTVRPLVNDDGQTIGAFSVNRDITERKQQERERARLLEREREAHAEAEAARAEASDVRQHLRDLFLQAPACICILRGPEHRVELINDAFRALSGWRELDGKTARESWPELEGQGFFELLDTVYTTGGPFVARELYVQIDRDNDGVLEDGYFNFVYQPARDAQGAVEGILVHATEVTDQVRAREAIQTSETAAQARARELEAVLDAMTDGVLVYGPGGRITRTNAAVNRLFGYRLVPDFAALPIAERAERVRVRDAAGQLVPVERLPQMRALAGETLMGLDAIDLRIATLYGTEIEVSASASPLRDAAGNIVGAVTVYHDVTKRRQLERELAERASQLDAIFDAMADGVVLYDEHGALIHWNAALAALFEFETMPDYATLPVTTRPAHLRVRDAQRRPIAPERLPFMRAARGEAVTGASAVDLIVTVPSGAERQVNVSAAPLRDETGRLIGAVAVYRDVTRQRRLEQRTREALDAVLAITRALVEPPEHEEEHDGSDEHETSQEGRAPRQDDERLVARRLAELTRDVLGCGRVSISAIEGEPLRARPVAVVGLSPEQEPQWWAEQEALAEQPMGAGMPPEPLERLLAGEALTLNMSEPPYDTQPNPYGVTTILVVPMPSHGRMAGLLAVDYSGEPHIFTREEEQLALAVARLGAVVLERERLLREREKARTSVLALAEANRRMDEFLSIAGHELRTPITTAKANTQLARRQLERSRQEAASAGDLTKTLDRLRLLLERTEQQLGRQDRLVTDLIDVSRIQAGKLEFRLDRCDLASLVREVVAEQRLVHPTRPIHLSAPQQPLPVQADADRIAQVVINYLTNALKYSPEEAPVTVTLRREGARARVSVRDQGPGIAPEEQARVWEQFHQVKGIKVQSGSGVGLGLGLHICKTIIERHGGAVGVESTPREGSTFWFTLPVLR